LAGQISGGELQTLISTLQNGNTQLGHIYSSLGGVAALSSLASSLSAIASAAVAMQMSEVVAQAGPGSADPLPDAPEGYVTINIPGVGERLIPYYPVS
jgi:hypothetical protein